MARFLLWGSPLSFLTFRDPLWHAFCYGSQLPKFNTLRQTLARFLLYVCACEIISRGTQHQELRKVKNENNLCAMLVC